MRDEAKEPTPRDEHAAVELTRILNEADDTQDGLSQAFHAVYGELRQLARGILRPGPERTLGPTALVHEAYARLIRSESLSIQGRRHFFALCARVMRNIITDDARRKLAGKRGGGMDQVTLLENDVIDLDQPESLVALDEALDWLATHDERITELLQLRIYGGLELAEIAPLLDVTVRQLQRDWLRAKAWLSEALVSGRS